MGDIPLLNYAYPMGRTNSRTKWCLGRHFESARGTNAGINVEATDLNALRANSIYSHNGIDSAYNLIDEVESNGGWLIFYTHDVRDDPSPFGCTEDDFERVLNRVAERKIRVRTVMDVVRDQPREKS